MIGWATAMTWETSICCGYGCTVVHIKIGGIFIPEISYYEPGFNIYIYIFVFSFIYEYSSTRMILISHFTETLFPDNLTSRRNMSVSCFEHNMFIYIYIYI